MSSSSSSTSTSEEFLNYVSQAIDPGDWILVGTIGICALLLVVSHLLIACVRSRQKCRRTKKAEKARLALQAAEESEENLNKLMPEPLDVFEKRHQKKDPRRLQGWNNIVTSIEQEASRERDPVQPDAAEMLQRDLFEDGGVVHQLNGYMSNTTTLPVDETDKSTQQTHVSANSDPGEYVLMEGETAEEAKMGKLWYLITLLGFDRETKKLLKLAIPYSLNGLVGSVFSIMTVAVIGRMLGSKALSAYLMVYYAVAIGTMFLEGLMTSLTSLCSQAIGAGKHTLAGQYVQISVMSYSFLFVPQIILWWFYFYDFMIWMEFDHEASSMGQGYARVFLIHSAFYILHSAIVYLLEVSGHETFVAVTGGLQSFLAFAVKFSVLWLNTFPYYGEPTLFLLGLLDLSVGMFFLICELNFVYWEGWLDDYMPGLVGSFAPMNARALKFFFKAAFPLSFGYVLSYGEWEFMFILAGVLGPAEVAVWGILGEIWGGLETLTCAWGDAAEVRCAKLLGAGEPELAQLSAHKALLLGTLVSGCLSGVLLGTMNYLPGLITDDSTLQSMLRETLPMVAIGNMVLALGTISWQLLGAQNRFSLATAVELVGSWLVTLPLALLSSLYLQWNLEGLVAAVVVGCMCSGMLNYAILRCTNWSRISEQMIRRNDKIAREGYSADSEDEESGYKGGPMTGDGLSKHDRGQPDTAVYPASSTETPISDGNQSSAIEFQENAARNDSTGPEATQTPISDADKFPGIPTSSPSVEQDLIDLGQSEVVTPGSSPANDDEQANESLPPVTQQSSGMESSPDTATVVDSGEPNATSDETNGVAGETPLEGLIGSSSGSQGKATDEKANSSEKAGPVLTEEAAEETESVQLETSSTDAPVSLEATNSPSASQQASQLGDQVPIDMEGNARDTEMQVDDDLDRNAVTSEGDDTLVASSKTEESGTSVVPAAMSIDKIEAARDLLSLPSKGTEIPGTSTDLQSFDLGTLDQPIVLTPEDHATGDATERAIRLTNAALEAAREAKARAEAKVAAEKAGRPDPPSEFH